MRIALMTNEDSGGGTDGRALHTALERHGAVIADDAPERIVVAGGDGSIGPAAERAAAAGVPLAVIAAGTANDFARSLALPSGDEAVRLAATGTRLRRLELGEIDGRPFVNVASAGLAPAAARRAEPLKKLLGPLAYSVGGLLAGLAETPLRLRAGSLHDGPAWQVTVACTGAFGGGAEIEQADPHDGRLDVVVVPAGRRVVLLRRAWGMRRGTLADQPGVVHARCEDLELQVAPGTPFNVDGEIVHAGPLVRLRVRGAFDLISP